MKVVLDTNVLISALIKQGKPRILLTKVIKSNHKLIVLEDILIELARVCNDRVIRKYVNQRDITEFLRIIASISISKAREEVTRVFNGRLSPLKMTRSEIRARARSRLLASILESYIHVAGKDLKEIVERK